MRIFFPILCIFRFVFRPRAERLTGVRHRQPCFTFVDDEQPSVFLPVPVPPCRQQEATILLVAGLTGMHVDKVKPLKARAKARE